MNGKKDDIALQVMLHNTRQNIFHKLGAIYLLPWTDNNDHETDACILASPHASHQNWPIKYICQQNKPPQPSISYFLNIILLKKKVYLILIY